MKDGLGMHGTQESHMSSHVVQGVTESREAMATVVCPSQLSRVIPDSVRRSPKL